jgi:4-hydroxythreonine-4-phosphate dehydrogenase
MSVDKGIKILLTQGDPNGIGPEIIIKIFKKKLYPSDCTLKVIGNKKVFDFYSKSLRLPFLNDNEIFNLEEYNNFIPNPGKIERISGKISAKSVIRAAGLCMLGNFDALVTMPVSKESFYKADYKYPGQTNLLSEITKSKSVSMFMVSSYISVALLTMHIPVREINKFLNYDFVFRKITSIHKNIVENMRIKNPAIAILGFNPHSGDGGVIGGEEQKVFLPVLKKLKQKNIFIDGPFSADAFFAGGNYKNYDLIISVYHDQGLIPFKLISRGKGVNYSAGLKIIRTSPSHGTAFDIAGKGFADTDSTVEAIKLAKKIYKYQKNG